MSPGCSKPPVENPAGTKATPNSSRCHPERSRKRPRARFPRSRRIPIPHHAQRSAQGVPPTNPSESSNTFPQQKSDSCDEQPLLRIPKSACSIHAPPLSQELRWIAMEDAERERRELTRRRARLEQALRIFRTNRKEGIPRPEKGPNPLTKLGALSGGEG